MRGLENAEALRLGIERALVLVDADALLIDRRATRRLLCATARCATVHRPLTTERSAYVQRLMSAPAPTPKPRANPLTARLPQELIARAENVVPLSALSGEAVDEMIAWELAAVLSGRTMAEWALLTLAARRRALAS